MSDEKIICYDHNFTGTTWYDLGVEMMLEILASYLPIPKT